MRKFITVTLVCLAAYGLTSYTDIHAYKKPDKKQASGSIKCYSGGKMIFSGDYAKAVLTDDAGYHFIDMRSKKRVSISADCVMIYNH